MRKKKKDFIRYFAAMTCLAAVLIALPIGTAHALKIIPERLIIKPDQKVAHVFVKNSSNKVKTYKFKWRHLAMKKDGTVVNLDKDGVEDVPDYKNADQLIRYSPRRTVLQPGDTQRVTLLLRRTPDLEDGEYRSHFVVEQEPDPAVQQQKTQPQEAEGMTSVGINLLVSRAFPVYLLHGETNAQLTVTKAELKKRPKENPQLPPDHLVHFTVQKEGNRSVIGTADVFCTNKGQEEKISKVQRIFVIYAEADTRDEKVLVPIPAGGCQSMRLLIKGHKDDILAGQVLGDIAVQM